MAFEKELETYRRELPAMMDRVGKQIVIQGEEVLGIFDTYADALQAAYKAYGPDAVFLVREIQPQEPVVFFTRRIEPVCRV